MAHNNKVKAKFNSKPYQGYKGQRQIVRTQQPAQLPDWKEPNFVVRFSLDTLMPIYKRLLVIGQALPQNSKFNLGLTQQSELEPANSLTRLPVGLNKSELLATDTIQSFLLEQTRLEYRKQLKTLGLVCEMICQSQQYHLLWEYHSYYQDQKLTNKLSLEESGIILSNLANVFWGVCLQKKAVLMGLGDYFFNKANYNPLWMPMPGLLEQATGEESGSAELYSHYKAVIEILPGLTGHPKQQAYDRLMLPNPNKWPSLEPLIKDNPLKVEKILAQSLGKPDGLFSQADLEQLIERVALEGKWILTPGRPVLIRLVDHPLIHQVVLMRKENYILAKLETHNYGDWLEIINLNDVVWVGTFYNFRNDALVYRNVEAGKPVNKKVDNNKNLENRAVPGLIVTLLLDLVTVEDVVATTPGRPSGNTNTTRHEKKSNDLEKWHWQYLPRKKYAKGLATHAQTGLGKNEGEENIIVERTALDPRQIDLQTKLKRFHMVGLYTRKLPPNQKPSPAKVAQAIDLGLKLGEGETWVAAHGRGVQELKRVVEEVGLDNIPHFMKKRTGLSSS